MEEPGSEPRAAAPPCVTIPGVPVSLTLLPGSQTKILLLIRAGSCILRSRELIFSKLPGAPGPGLTRSDTKEDIVPALEELQAIPPTAARELSDHGRAGWAAEGAGQPVPGDLTGLHRKDGTSDGLKTGFINLTSARLTSVADAPCHRSCPVHRRCGTSP